MKICSFLPSATEIVYALGLQDSLCGVTFECDYPLDVRNKPVMVRSIFDQMDPRPTASGEISQIIGQRLKDGLGIYDINLDGLQAAEPDLLLTQTICEVCAVSSRQVSECSINLPNQPKVLSLDPQYIGDVLGNIRQVAELTGTAEEGEKLISHLRGRINNVAEKASYAASKPRVLHLEWGWTR